MAQTARCSPKKADCCVVEKNCDSRFEKDTSTLNCSIFNGDSDGGGGFAIRCN